MTVMSLMAVVVHLKEQKTSETIGDYHELVG